jgi:N-acyl-D-aspartate/D-glutamate deacylase
MTLLPRSVVLPALRERGVLEDGKAADLTVFDPAAIRGTATVDNPNQFSAGIELVVVNGGVAYQDGALATRRGTAIRY